MALCSARVEPGIGWERQDPRDLGTRVLMKFLRSAFEGPESHQCRTMGPKRGPQEETYAWTCWSNALQKPYMRGFLEVQGVPIAIYEGLFASAKCPHRQT